MVARLVVPVTLGPAPTTIWVGSSTLLVVGSSLIDCTPSAVDANAWLLMSAPVGAPSMTSVWKVTLA